MAHEKHLAVLKQGVQIWNQWRKNNKAILPVLNEVNLSRANFCKADFNWANFRGTNLSEVNLRGANLSQANLTEANLSGANLCEANLSKARLEYVQLKHTLLNDETLIEEKWRLVWEIINHGASQKNLIGVDLSEANLSHADLSGANLSKANLTRTNLSGANLNGANLTGVNLSEANLIHADLSGANLTGAALFKADITGADISEANFSQTNITGPIGASLKIEELYEVYIIPEMSVTCASPVRDKAKLYDILHSWESQVPKIRLSSSIQNPLPAILLYTEEDQLSYYIRNCFENIDKISGDFFIIYLIEKPPVKWRNSNLYWKDICEFYLYKIIPIFHWCRRIKNKPYSKFEVYDIARQWRIELNMLPCLVLLNPKNISEKIVLNINKNIPSDQLEYYFRDLFSELDKRLLFDEIQKKGKSKLNSLATFNQIKTDFQSIVKFLEERYSKKEKGKFQQIINLQNAQFAGGFINAETVQSQHIGGNIENTDNQV